MSKITGIGGVFLKLDTDTEKLLKWYKDVLELDTSEYGINILEPNRFTLITFNRSESEAILNFTVDDIEAFSDKLKKKNVVIHKDIDTYEYGKFLQIIDIAGNIIELWEPVEDFYKEMVTKEIKEYSGE
ncbi:MAG: hypothetical protein WBA54_14910 [Acidaminobacteraceae bacterium]